MNQYQQPAYSQHSTPPAYAAAPPTSYSQQAPPQYLQQGSQQRPDATSQWFASIDTDRSGELDSAELQRALQLAGLNYGITDVDAMIRAFDTRGRRKLNLQEFGALHNFLTSVQGSFSYFDRDRSQSLQSPEVSEALRHAGFALDAPVVKAMMTRHDPDNNGAMSLDEFIRMCLFLQSCARTFTAFDPNKTGRVTLDFGQFVYASSHIA
ncbi:hypothetical protein V8C86DRAFT_2450115, partial [Haematococcus lacustris]